MTFKDFYTSKTVSEAIIQSIPDPNFYTEYLKKKGWNLEGRGAKGFVFSKNNKDYVLKFYKNDPCYDKFLDYLEKNQNNPYLPKIKRRILPGNIGLVALEKLQPLKSDKLADYITGMMGDIVSSHIRVKDLSFNEVMRRVEPLFKSQIERLIDNSFYDKVILKKVLRRLDYFIEIHLPIFKTMYDFKKFLENNPVKDKDCLFDAHLGNFMVRPSTKEIVITDPVI